MPAGSQLGVGNMKRTMFVTAAAVCLVCATVANAVEEMPKRKPGLWEITTVLPVVGPKKVKICIGAADDIAKPENAAGPCSAPKMTRSGDGVVVDVVCTSPQGKQTINMAFSGDFETQYHGKLKMTFDPPIAGMDNMAMTIDGKYLGPDC